MALEYFKLFEIPVKLKVNADSLSRRYFELSRKFHPDYFANAAPEAQAESLEKSALLNRALKTLQQPDETLKYVLIEKGLLEEEEKYQLPADFLMEVMELNEALTDAGDDENTGKLKQKIKNLETEIYAPVKQIIENYEEGVTTEKELLQVKEYYYKKKYLKRIK